MDTPNWRTLVRLARALRLTRYRVKSLYRWRAQGVWQAILDQLQQQGDAQHQIDWEVHGWDDNYLLKVLAQSSKTTLNYEEVCAFALSALPSYLWAPKLFDRLGSECDLIKVPSQVFSCWLEALCYTA